MTTVVATIGHLHYNFLLTATHRVYKLGMNNSVCCFIIIFENIFPKKKGFFSSVHINMQTQIMHFLWSGFFVVVTMQHDVGSVRNCYYISTLTTILFPGNWNVTLLLSLYLTGKYRWHTFEIEKCKKQKKVLSVENSHLVCIVLLAWSKLLLILSDVL